MEEAGGRVWLRCLLVGGAWKEEKGTHEPPLCWREAMCPVPSNGKRLVCYSATPLPFQPLLTWLSQGKIQGCQVAS